MFEEWGFLLGEMWVLIALAALIGLIAGWLIFGGKTEVAADTGDADRLRADLDKCRAQHREKDAQIASLRAELDGAVAKPVPPPPAVPAAAAVVAAEPAVAPLTDDFDGDGIAEGTNEGVKPTTLDAPLDGMADDLKQIKGVGLKMEKLCNELGFWHFDQIAAWTPAEVAWVDANLQGFKGRVTRDDWVAQASLLASGGETAFSKKVDKGDVY